MGLSGPLCLLKERKKVIRCGLAQYLRTEIAQISQEVPDMAHPSWLIGLAAHRHRSEIRRIGFNQHAIQRNVLGYHTQVGGIFKGHNA